MLLLDLVTNQRLLLLKKNNVDRYERLQARRTKQSQHYSEHQKQGQKCRRKHCKSDSEAQQIPGEVPNYVSLDLCSQAITVMLQIIVLGLLGVVIM